MNKPKLTQITILRSNYDAVCILVESSFILFKY